MNDAVILGLRVADVAMLVAVIIGPLLAVWYTKNHDKKDHSYRNRLTVFRALMKTRRARLDPEHVGALNLIEVEFHKDQAVMNSYSRYMEHLGLKVPTTNEEQDSYFRERSDRFAALLQSIGKNLKYNFDKLDLDRGAYFPIGWGNEQEVLQKNQALLTELLEGRRSLPIFHMQFNQSKFPPPPSNTPGASS